MKIEINLSKNNDVANPALIVTCEDQQIDLVMEDMQQVVCMEVAHKPIGTYTLSISRHEPFTGTTHATWVKIESIRIDEFWEIAQHNHWSKTSYDPDYMSIVSKMENSWELTKDLYNDTLFFNGSISYEITAPVRKMFWS